MKTIQKYSPNTINRPNYKIEHRLIQQILKQYALIPPKKRISKLYDHSVRGVHAKCCFWC